MNNVPSCEQECKAGAVIAAILLGLIALNTTGCVPAVLGIKTYQSGDTRIDFVTGWDASASVNGIDTVNNKRGIAPSSNPNYQAIENR